MVNYDNHSKFIYANYDEIQNGIHEGTIDVNDILYTKDTHENVIVSPDYTIYPVQCRVYRFNDTTSANEILNKNTDTYAGQIVAILGSKGNYSAYIVNKRPTGLFAVDPLNINDSNVTIDYDLLGNRPIINLNGEMFNPIILNTQSNGIYKVKGSYKISSDFDTVFYGGESYLFMIEHQEDGSVMIKRIGVGEITDFIVTTDGQVTSSAVPTTKWMEEQGYVTENYVYSLINNMNLITKDEIEQYVTEVVNNSVTIMVQNAVTEEFDKRFQPATEREALDIFVDVFK